MADIACNDLEGRTYPIACCGVFDFSENTKEKKTDQKDTKEKKNGKNSSYVIKNSDRKRLVKKDVSHVRSIKTVQTAINEMAARHGHSFQKKSYSDVQIIMKNGEKKIIRVKVNFRKYFQKKSWYKEIKGKKVDKESGDYSNLEKANYDYLIGIRNRLGRVHFAKTKAKKKKLQKELDKFIEKGA